MESNDVCDCWASGNNGGNKKLLPDLDATNAAVLIGTAVGSSHDSRMLPSIIPGISPSASWTSQRDSNCCEGSRSLLLLADAMAAELMVERETQELVGRTLRERVLEK